MVLKRKRVSRWLDRGQIQSRKDTQEDRSELGGQDHLHGPLDWKVLARFRRGRINIRGDCICRFPRKTPISHRLNPVRRHSIVVDEAGDIPRETYGNLLGLRESVEIWKEIIRSRF